MGKIVYLQKDKMQVLYDADSVPSHLKTVEPDAATLLRILKKKLQLLEIVNLDWMNCAISFILPRNPVYYPTKEGIQSLYEKSVLTDWLAKTGGVGKDPTGLSQEVTIKDYKAPTTDEIITFVITTSAIEREFLVNNYVEFNSEEEEEEEVNFEEVPLISETRRQQVPGSPSKPSRASWLRGIFCCIPSKSNEAEESKNVTPTITY